MTHQLKRMLVVLAAALTVSTACGGGDDLSVTEAEAGLRSSPTFTERPGSPVGRELVEIVAVRRIGRRSTEVEFTWRDAGSAGQPAAGLRTSMALFRQRDNGVWALNSLYKVN
jgi:hypothetical protein